MSKNTKVSFLLSANERQLINMTEEAIVAEVVNHYADHFFVTGEDPTPSRILQAFETRKCHAGILFALGKKLEAFHPEQGRKLILASIYWGENRGIDYLDAANRKTISHKINVLIKEEYEKREKAKRMKRR